MRVTGLGAAAVRVAEEARTGVESPAPLRIGVWMVEMPLPGEGEPGADVGVLGPGGRGEADPEAGHDSEGGRN